MPILAIIGGSGLTNLKNLQITKREVVRTPYGDPSGPLVYGGLHGQDVVFLPRHGHGHTIPPHLVNYRANLWALKQAGVQTVVAVGAVGGIRETLKPGMLVLPDQIIDYTYSRAQSFFDGGVEPVTHVDFSYPYCESLRKVLLESADSAGIELMSSGTYATTQGPRFETSAEINRLERDGADLVGMTGMPETALARELDLCYATIAVVVNLAAGRGEGGIAISDLQNALDRGMTSVRRLLEFSIPEAVKLKHSATTPLRV
ncbi:MAG: S-methyl-5'-thioinosine phosphorylase [Gammaproteobacteria bacterium]|nr:S-methyl-5'-thioinosine phosphorylase [Gammaproteobacteria bacterium]